jgi:hypothetical protein
MFSPACVDVFRTKGLVYAACERGPFPFTVLYYAGSAPGQWSSP